MARLAPTADVSDMNLAFTPRIASLRFARELLDTGEFDALVSIGHPDGTENVTEPWPALSIGLGIWDATPNRRGDRPLFTGNQCL